MQKEGNYDFYRRLLTVHQPDRRDNDLRPEADEFSFPNTVKICIPADGDEMLMTSAKDIADYLFTSMGIEAFLSRHPSDPSHTGTLVLRTDPTLDLGQRGYRITVDEDVIVEAADSRGIAQGLYYLEDLMNLRQAPFLKKGQFSGSLLFDARTVMSGYGIGEYPDDYLSLLAHHGFTGLMLWIKGINESQKGFQNFKDLALRASKYGFDIYVESYSAHSVYPEGEEAQKFYDELYGKLFDECPFIKGLIIVGEAVKFPSRDPSLRKGSSSGWYPCCDWPLLLDMIRNAVDKIKPDVEIIFSSYNWGYRPKELRQKLIASLPDKVILNCGWEMFEKYDLDGAQEACSDYSLRIVKPGYYFLTEAEAAKKRGLRLDVIANTGGKTWDFGAIPYTPAPYRWAQRFEELRIAHDEHNLSSLMDSIHFGVYPSMITEIAKWAFRQPRVDLESLIPQIIAMYFGKAQLEDKVKALQLWSEALANMVPTNEDQYGALRVGPSHPIYAGREPFMGVSPPQDKFAMHKLERGMYNNVYSYCSDGSPGPVRLPKEIRAYDHVRDCLAAGIALLDSIKEKNEALERLINMGRFMYRTILTALNTKKFFLLDQERLSLADGKESSPLIRQMIDILLSERENVICTIPLVEFDSVLGFEPSMEYVTDKKRLLWKLDQLDEEIRMLRSLM